MSADDVRAKLAAQQRQLVAALVGGDARAEDDAANVGSLAAPFDPRHVQSAAAALLRKRMREVEKAWPGVAAGLGERFAASFAAYACENRPAADGGGLADGRRFFSWIAARATQGDAAWMSRVRAEIRCFDQHLCLAGGRLVHRRPLQRFFICLLQIASMK